MARCNGLIAGVSNVSFFVMVINKAEEELYELSHMSSDKTKKIYQEEIESMKKFLIETYVEYLQNTTHGKKAYEYSRKLRNYYGNG